MPGDRFEETGAMDHRDAPRTGLGDKVKSLPSPKDFPRLLSHSSLSHARWSRRHLALAGSLACLALALGAWVVGWVIHGSFAYLRRQPSYRLALRDVVFSPEPPAWYRGGKEALCDSVAQESGLPPTFSALDVDLGRVRDAFSLNPVVRRVDRVVLSHDAGLEIRLEYREPVARAEIPGQPPLILDREGAILPRDEIEVARAGTLVWISRFPAPFEPKVGHFWYRRDPDRGAPVRDPRIQEAAHLAGLVRDHLQRKDEALPPIPFVVISPLENQDLILQFGANLLFRWETAREPAVHGELSDAERWKLVTSWVKSHPPQKESRTYQDLAFAKRGVILLETRINDAIEPPRPPG